MTDSARSEDSVVDSDFGADFEFDLAAEDAFAAVVDKTVTISAGAVAFAVPVAAVNAPTATATATAAVAAVVVVVATAVRQGRSHPVAVAKMAVLGKSVVRRRHYCHRQSCTHPGQRLH